MSNINHDRYRFREDALINSRVTTARMNLFGTPESFMSASNANFFGADRLDRIAKKIYSTRSWFPRFREMTTRLWTVSIMADNSRNKMIFPDVLLSLPMLQNAPRRCSRWWATIAETISGETTKCTEVQWKRRESSGRRSETFGNTRRENRCRLASWRSAVSAGQIRHSRAYDLNAESRNWNSRVEKDVFVRLRPARNLL